MVLARDPICTMCREAPATEVDHKVPKAAGGTDSFANLRGVCKPCHSRKTAQEDRRWGARGPAGTAWCPKG